jgi:hypothetical protein
MPKNPLMPQVSQQAKIGVALIVPAGRWIAVKQQVRQASRTVTHYRHSLSDSRLRRTVTLKVKKKIRIQT